MKVAFLGLGAIGAPMARHLASRYTLSVWNRTAERAVEFARATGSRAAASPADAVRGATLAVTCLPTSREVEQLLEGPEGMLAAFDAGATLVDCTSGDPATSRRIAERLAARGVGFVDAPVSGGVSGAVKGILTIMCGGDESAMQRARPVLEAFGEKIVHCGPVGAGHAVKAVNQALLGIQHAPGERDLRREPQHLRLAALQDLPADLHVAAHLLGLLGVERTRLGQDRVRDPELADVVKRGRQLDQLDLALAEPDLDRQQGGTPPHADRVGVRLAVAPLGGGDQPIDGRELRALSDGRGLHTHYYDTKRGSRKPRNAEPTDVLVSPRTGRAV